MANYLSPDQIKEYTVEAGIAKAGSSFSRSFLLSFMGGMFIALAAIGSMIATYTIDNAGISSLIAGCVFSTGLMMVVIAGGDLFTGNVLITVSVLEKRTTVGAMLSNLSVTFAGNLCGALFIVVLVQYSGLLSAADGMLLNRLMLKAAHKIEYSFHQAFILGILCNLLVCIAVWMMYSAKDTGGKVLACFFPIALFILSGYEHIVANMYYIPAGILAAADGRYVALAGISAPALSQLTPAGAIGNFIPVTLGNLVGGLIVGTIYYSIYKGRNVPKSLSRFKISA